MKILVALLISFSFSFKVFAKDIVLNNKNFVEFYHYVNLNSVLEVAAKVDLLNNVRGDKDYPIYVVINSLGGEIRPGFHFARAARVIPNLHFIALEAGSSSFTIFQASPGSRFFAAGGRLMVHAGSMILPYINDEQWRAQLESVREDDVSEFKTMHQINIAKTFITEEKYQEYIVNGEKWFTQKEIENLNIADEVIVLKCSQEVKKCPQLRSYL